MNNEAYINKLIDDAINSTEKMERAKPAPFLLTRVNARIAASKETAWDKAAGMLSSPRVLVACLCLILLGNALVIFISNRNNAPGLTEQVAAPTAEEMNEAVTGIYETDNP